MNRKSTLKNKKKQAVSWNIKKIGISVFTIITLFIFSSGFSLKTDIFKSISESPTDADAWEYIERYKDLAIIEMHRSGIPASITLAQGLHETNFGKSRLYKEANNHFGIKCKSYWVGTTFYYKDDDKDKAGTLIESCFRSYGSALASYVDHSNFLVNSPHYASLFEYGRKDYESWAHGLKKCGYATDPNYAYKLIDKVNRYYLNQFDEEINPMKR